MRSKTSRGVGVAVTLALIGTLLLQYWPPTPAQAEPQDNNYTASASGELLALRANLLNLIPLANLPLGWAAADVDTQRSSNNATARAANISLAALGLGLSIDRTEAFSPPASNPPVKNFLGVNLGPLAQLAVLSGDVEASYQARDRCPAPNSNGVAVISKAHAQVAGLSLVDIPTTNINIAHVGAVEKTSTTEIAGDTLRSTVSSSVADTRLLGNRIRLSVSGPVTLTAESNGSRGRAYMSNTLLHVYVDNVLVTSLKLGDGVAVNLGLNLGLVSATVRIGVGTFQDTSSGKVGSGSLDSILSASINVTALFGLEVADVGIRVGGGDATAHVRSAELDCGQPVRCDQLADWGSFVTRYGATPASTFDSVAEARRACFLACPQLTSNSGNPSDWVRSGRSEAFIPRLGSPDTSTDSGRGDWCFQRAMEQRQKLIRGVTVDNSGGGEVFAWQTRIEDGMSPGQKPGTPFQLQQEEELTTYGVLVQDCLATGNPAACWPTQAQVTAARNADAQRAHARVDLNAHNRTALAEGGVMNVSESQLRLPRLVLTGAIQSCVRGRTGSYQFTYSITAQATMTTQASNSGTWSANCPAGAGVIEGAIEEGSANTSQGWINDPLALGDVFSTYSTTATPEAVSYWQAFTNHCNSEAYSYLQNVNSRLRERTIPSHLAPYSVYGITELLTNPADAPFGRLANNETDRRGYYDKQCAYDGRQAETNGQSAVAETFFRDGEFHSSHADLYRPDGSAYGTLTAANGDQVPVILDDGAQASHTIITRWIQGSPTPVDAGQLRTKSADGQAIFWEELNPFPLLTNFTPTPVTSSQEWAIIGGEHSEVQWAAQWASEKGKPQVYKLRWEYAPLVGTYLPAVAVGFGPQGAQSYGRDAVPVRVRGSVFGRTDGQRSIADHEEARLTTGSPYGSFTADPSRRQDARLMAGPLPLDGEGRWQVDPAGLHSMLRTVKFVRATGS